MIRKKFEAGLGAAMMVWLLAGTAMAEEPKEPLPEKPAEQMERLSLSLGLNPEALAEAYPEQARWLDTEEHGRSLVLFEREHTGAAKGAILILADEGQTAGTQLAGALREPFARGGWAAMSMGLPAMPLALRQGLEAQQLAEQGASEPASGGQPAADGEGAISEAGDGEATSVMIDVMAGDTLAELSDGYSRSIQAHLAAAVAELKGQGYERLVLLGIGRGAAQVTRQALDGQGGSALVWIAPVFPFESTETLAAELRASGSLRILDMVSSREAVSAARERAALMQRNGFASSYSQQSVAMPGQPLSRNAGQVANRLLAWLGR